MGQQHFHSILVSRIRACHEELLQVLAEAEYMWLLSLAAPSHGCGAELESIRTCGCDKLPVPRGDAPINPVSMCLTLGSKVIARQYFILVSFSVNSYQNHLGN